MSTPFDRALEQRELQAAAEAYASHHGEPGTADHRAAWLRFRHEIKTGAELRRRRRVAQEFYRRRRIE